MIIMNRVSCADLVWVATALLTRENPDRASFSSAEIRAKIDEIEPEHGFEQSTVATHIAVHCVANRKPDPGKHRKLYLEPGGAYRLFNPGDPSDPGRKDGKLLPLVDRLPPQYRELLEWYSGLHRRQPPKEDEDPILALRGIGKELWKSLGGGDKFIREMRGNWHG